MRILFFLVLASFLLKLLYLVPGTGDPEIYLRPDSPSYLAPARSLLYDLTYSTGAGTGEAALHRTPLYPCFLALCLGISGGSLLFVAVVSAFLSSLTLIPLFLSAKIFLPEKYALFASLLFLLHPTVFAVFPLVTSDTLFLLLVTLVLYFYLRFLKERSLSFLLWSAFAATLAVLTRPLMLFWGFPALFVLFCLPRFPLKKKVLFSLLFLLVFFLLPACWILRNHARGGGWRIDIVSADTAKHNVSTFESRRNGIPAYVLREQYDREAEEAYRKEPEKYASLSARLAFHEERLIRTMKE
ncbi:MAG: glycosyltransferase family 39 protein, partial [Lentisphaeria bacterium]|nr:glycosyltransferase family 39 protein [Lentisphaeria bacterium]